MEQKVLANYFRSSIGVQEYLQYLISEGYHIDSFSYQLMPKAEVEYSCVVVVSKQI